MVDTPTIAIRLESGSAHSMRHEAITRVTGLASPKELVELLDHALLLMRANPRESSGNKVTKAIMDGLITRPQSFQFHNRGLLLAASKYRHSGDKWDLTFVGETEGVLDGLHSLLCIGTHLMNLVRSREGVARLPVRNWRVFSDHWQNYRDEIQGGKISFNFLVPVEILLPVNQNSEAAARNFRADLFDICEARNNNRQLSVSTRANQRGFYDGIREMLPRKIDANVRWKDNGGEIILSPNLVSLVWIPVNLLLKREVLKARDESFCGLPSPVLMSSLQSRKGSTIESFVRLTNALLGPREDGQAASNTRLSLSNEQVHNAFSIMADLPRLHDMIYLAFPSAHDEGGKRRFRSIQHYVHHNSTSPREDISRWKTPFYQIPSRDYKNPYLAFERLGRGEKFALPETGFSYSVAYILPLVCGLQSLMDIDEKGRVVWAVRDPAEFLKKNLSGVVSTYAHSMFSRGRNPDIVGKDETNYEIARSAFEIALLRS